MVWEGDRAGRTYRKVTSWSTGSLENLLRVWGLGCTLLSITSTGRSVCQPSAKQVEEITLSTSGHRSWGDQAEPCK